MPLGLHPLSFSPYPFNLRRDRVRGRDGRKNVFKTFNPFNRFPPFNAFGGSMFKDRKENRTCTF
jgi:hypothetical protein